MKTTIAGIIVMAALVAQGQTIETTRVEKIDPDGVPVVEVTKTETLPKLAVATTHAETSATITFQGNDTIYDCPNDTIPPDGCDSVAPQAGTAPCGWWRYRKRRIYNGATCPPNNPTKFTFHVRDRCDATHYFWIGTWQPINWTGRCDRIGYRATFNMTAQYPQCIGGSPYVDCGVCPPDQGNVFCSFSGVNGCDIYGVSLGGVTLTPYGVGNYYWDTFVPNGYGNMWDIHVVAHCDNDQLWVSAGVFGGYDLFYGIVTPPSGNPITLVNMTNCNADLGYGGIVTVAW